jgi:hypothetical protein
MDTEPGLNIGFSLFSCIFSIFLRLSSFGGNLIIRILESVTLKTKSADSIHETFSTDTSWAASHTETTTTQAVIRASSSA